jgi:hypothetical protein
MSKWSVFHNDSKTNPEGWRFAQRWDNPDTEWVKDCTITPISRSGLVARRIWMRIMKKCPAGQTYVPNMDVSENEDVGFETLPTNAVVASVSSPSQADISSRRVQPVKASSLSARLVGLVAGTSKGK